MNTTPLKVHSIPSINYDDFLYKIKNLHINVSRETFCHLVKFLALLKETTKVMNLVAESSLPDIWERHVVDSIQLYPILLEHLKSPQDIVVDLGSGAGFPGVILALLSIPNMILVEAKKKKCGFLQNVSRETFCQYQVLDKRIEDLQLSQPPRIITARALAPLEKLLEYTFRWLSKDTVGIFPKGETWEEELKTAEQKWKFQYEVHPSLTNPKAKILTIHHLKRKR